MCRSIKTLRSGSVPAPDDEVRAAALQFVRKITGFTKPSKANQEMWDRALDEITSSASELLRSVAANIPVRTSSSGSPDTVVASSK